MPTISPIKLALAASVVATTLAASASAQTYCRIAPFFWPDGRVQYPFHSLQASIWSAPAGGTVNIAPGNYYEPQTINKRVTLTTTTSSPATIGATAANVVPLKIVSYNTHLFGNEVIPGLPRWLDDERAPHIAGAAISESADVFCFQEVWDHGIYEVMRAITLPFYPSGYYGGEIFGGSFLNSGLFTLSKFGISDAYQFPYSEEDGTWEAAASKGFIRTTIIKGGIPITIFNTHTQSGDSAGNVEARASQLSELAVAISIWRSFHPTHVIFAVGDFNVIGLSGEYAGTLQSMIGNTAGMADGAKNFPVAGNADFCTSCSSNELHEYFSEGGGSDTRLDYIFYIGALDDSVRVVPKAYFRKPYQIAASSPELCDDGLCTRDLSDHYGVMMEFDLVRR